MWKRISAETTFDPSIKTTLNNLESPVPAYIWPLVAAENKKDKRRPIFWWWWAAGIAILLGGAAILLSKNGSQKIVHNNISPSANESQTKQQSAGGGGQSASSQSSQGHDFQSAANPSSNTVLSPQPGSENGTISQNTKPLLPAAIKGQQSAVSSKQTTINSQKSIVKSQSQYGHQTADIRHQKIKYQASKNSSKSSIGFVNDNQASKEAKQPHANVYNSGSESFAGGEKNNLEKENAQEENTEPERNLDAEKLLVLNSQLRASFHEKLMPNLLQKAPSSIPIYGCPSVTGPVRNDWYLEGYVSPDLTLKAIQDKPFGKSAKGNFDSTLYSQMGVSAGILVAKNIGQNWLVKTGVNFSQTNELFKYTNINEIRFITIITVRQVIISPGDTLFIRDTSMVQQTGTAVKQTQNYYRHWDIPLIFGYEFGGKDLRLNANFGAIFNINSSYHGNLLDTTQKLIDIANYNGTGIYKTNIGLGLYAGLSILKPIGEGIDLFVEPHARINLGNMTNTNAFFNQRNNVLGLNIGIRYKINGRGQR